MQALIPSVAVTALVLAGVAGAQVMPKLPSPIKFDNVRLLVTRFDETFAFYRDVLGLTPTWGKPGDNYASFAFPGGAQIALFKRSLMAEAVGTAAQPATRREQDTAALVLTVDDVDALYARLKPAGIEFADAPRDQPVWGIRAMHFRDPDGNLIEVFSPLKK
jgi:catechol 2,3-dioxygenase-like lactoylglutathione lyase family enzyme